MDFEKLVEVYEQLEKTASGNEIREILSTFFKSVPKDEIALVSYLTLGQIGSHYEGLVLGMAEKSMLKSIAVAGGVDLKKVSTVFQECGDIGLTAERVLQKKPRTLVAVGKLNIHEFYEKLHLLAESAGLGSQEAKSIILVSLLQKTSPRGAKYVTRIVLGTLRMGVGDMTVLDALAIAYTGEKKNKECLERAFNICPDVGIIAETLAKEGLKGLEKIDIQVGRPIQMMLAQRVEELNEVLEKMPGKVAVEGKYDGERVQAHKDKKGKISLFSRNLEHITAQFPDLVSYLGEYIEAKEFVIEGEIVAIDDKGNPLPFQILMQRRRKYDIAEFSKKIPLQVKVFDVLFYNGKSYLHQPHEKRLELVEKLIKKNKQIMVADYTITEEVAEIEDFFQEMLSCGYEGVMIKSQGGEYQAGTRGWNWIKWKKEYVKDLVDTFDLAIVGGYHGKGRRSGVYGALLCAVYNEKTDQFETVCKLGTGLTDEVLEELPKKLSKYKVEKRPARLIVGKEMEPDVWFLPEVVVEVLAAEVTKSPFHTAGVALRFPRFIRFREDKSAEQATTHKEVEKMVKK